MIVWVGDLHSWIKAMILAAKDPQVDAINMAVAGVTNRYALRDADRREASSRNGWPSNTTSCFWPPTGIVFGMGTIGETGSGSRTLGIGALSWAREMFEMNYGAEIQMDGTRIWTSGPSAGGRAQAGRPFPRPEASAGYPGWRLPDFRKGMFDLPAGYGWLGGHLRRILQCAGLRRRVDQRRETERYRLQCRKGAPRHRRRCEIPARYCGLSSGQRRDRHSRRMEKLRS